MAIDPIAGSIAVAFLAYLCRSSQPALIAMSSISVALAVASGVQYYFFYRLGSAAMATPGVTSVTLSPNPAPDPK